MNVYDFDKTIYKKDSSVEFYLFALRKKPWLVFYSLPIQVVAFIKYKLKLISKEILKEKYFCFLKYIDTRSMVEKFVKKEKMNIANWYLKQKRLDDVVISASPEFIVKPFMQQFNIQNVIASQVDEKYGVFFTKNCHGKEKVKRFKEKYKIEEMEKFYSDSQTDKPMAQMAKMAFIVKGEEICEWQI